MQKPSVEYVEALENFELLMLLFQDLQKMYDRFCKWDRLVRYLTEYSNNDQQNCNY